jgi:WD40 repeat protein
MYMYQAFDNCMLIVRDHSASVNSVAFSPDGTWFCSASKDKTIRVHDGVSGELKMVLQGHAEDVRSVAISKDSRLFATAGLSGLLRMWDAHSGVQTLLFKELENTAINAVGFSCDSSWLAAAGENGVCICFNVIGTSSCVVALCAFLIYLPVFVLCASLSLSLAVSLSLSLSLSFFFSLSLFLSLVFSLSHSVSLTHTVSRYVV